MSSLNDHCKRDSLHCRRVAGIDYDPSSECACVRVPVFFDSRFESIELLILFLLKKRLEVP